jgi:hypothetical protein
MMILDGVARSCGRELRAFSTSNRILKIGRKANTDDETDSV